MPSPSAKPLASLFLSGVFITGAAFFLYKGTHLPQVVQRAPANLTSQQVDETEFFEETYRCELTYTSGHDETKSMMVDSKQPCEDVESVLITTNLKMNYKLQAETLIYKQRHQPDRNYAACFIELSSKKNRNTIMVTYQGSSLIQNCDAAFSDIQDRFPGFNWTYTEIYLLAEDGQPDAVYKNHCSFLLFGPGDTEWRLERITDRQDNCYTSRRQTISDYPGAQIIASEMTNLYSFEDLIH